MLIDLDLDTFEDRMSTELANQNFEYLRDEAIKAAQWLEEFDGNLDNVFEKLNNATSLFCQVAAAAAKLQKELDRMASTV